MHNGKFSSKKLDVVKTNCRSSLNSLKEDASNYSVMRMFEELDSKAPFSYRMAGYLEDLDLVNEENLYEYYQSMIKSDLVDIFTEEDRVILKKYHPLNYKFHQYIQEIPSPILLILFLMHYILNQINNMVFY